MKTLIISISVSIILLIIGLCIPTSSYITNGKVIDKHYKMPESKLALTTVNNSSASALVSSSAEFICSVNIGYIIDVDCTSDVYYTKNIGDNINVKVKTYMWVIKVYKEF